jgi:nicotinic acid mononucleotide adenylyltransferase
MRIVFPRTLGCTAPYTARTLDKTAVKLKPHTDLYVICGWDHIHPFFLGEGIVLEQKGYRKFVLIRKGNLILKSFNKPFLGRSVFFLTSDKVDDINYIHIL